MKKKNEGPYTKESIIKLLMENPKAVIKGITTIYEYQTNHEKNIKHTIQNNGVGFNAPDSKYLSELAIKIKKEGGLYKNDFYKARAKMIKYAGQLATIANQKAAKKMLDKAV